MAWIRLGNLTSGPPEIYYAKAESQLTAVERIARAEEFFSRIAVTLRHWGNRAYYGQELDYVQMPIIAWLANGAQLGWLIDPTGTG